MLKSAGFWSVVFFLLGSGLQVSGFQNAYLAYFFWAGSAFLLFYAVSEAIFGTPHTDVTTSALPEYVSLRDAAGIVFHGIKDTLIGGFCQTLGKEDHLLDYIGTYIFEVVPVYGKFKVSSVREELPRDILKTHGIVGGAKKVRPHGSQDVIYRELEIQRVDVEKAVALLRTLSAEKYNKSHVQKFESDLAK